MGDRSYTSVDEFHKGIGRDQAGSPLIVETRRRLRCDGLLDRSSLLLQLCYPFTDGAKHVIVFDELRLLPDWTMTRHNDSLVVHTPEVPSGCRDHPVEAAAVVVVDKWIKAVEPSVARMKYVGPSEPYRDVAI